MAGLEEDAPRPERRINSHNSSKLPGRPSAGGTEVPADSRARWHASLSNRHTTSSGGQSQRELKPRRSAQALSSWSVARQPRNHCRMGSTRPGSFGKTRWPGPRGVASRGPPPRPRLRRRGRATVFPPSSSFRGIPGGETGAPPPFSPATGALEGTLPRNQGWPLAEPAAQREAPGRPVLTDHNRRRQAFAMGEAAAGGAFDDIMSSLNAPLIVVTTAAGQERAGCLVGFHSQSSIEPARYCVWLSKANHTYRVALQSTHLAVHFLTSADLPLAERFGTMTGDSTDKFAGCRYARAPAACRCWGSARTGSRARGPHCSMRAVITCAWSPSRWPRTLPGRSSRSGWRRRPASCPGTTTPNRRADAAAVPGPLRQRAPSGAPPSPVS